MRLCVVLLAICLVGCTTTYRKYGVSQHQAGLDSRHCQAIARGGVTGHGGGLAGLAYRLEGEVARYEACMMEKGYWPDE